MVLLHGIYNDDSGLCACGKSDCVVYLAYQNSQLPFPSPTDYYGYSCGDTKCKYFEANPPMDHCHCQAQLRAHDISPQCVTSRLVRIETKVNELAAKLDTLLDFIAEYEQVAKKGADLLNSPGGKVLGFLKGRG
jgi:hypothetical protein